MSENGQLLTDTLLRQAGQWLGILVSILLAFGIDAWWEDRGAVRDQAEHLAAVESEIRLQQETLDDLIGRHRGFVERVDDAVENLGSPDYARDRLPGTVGSLLAYPTTGFNLGALHAALASGAIAQMEDTELRSALSAWPDEISLLREMESQGSRLHWDFMRYLSDNMPGFARIRAYNTGGHSRFVSDNAELVADFRFENHLMLRRRISAALLVELERIREASGDITSRLTARSPAGREAS